MVQSRYFDYDDSIVRSQLCCLNCELSSEVFQAKRFKCTDAIVMSLQECFNCNVSDKIIQVQCFNFKVLSTMIQL